MLVLLKWLHCVVCTCRKNPYVDAVTDISELAMYRLTWVIQACSSSRDKKCFKCPSSAQCIRKKKNYSQSQFFVSIFAFGAECCYSVMHDCYEVYKSKVGVAKVQKRNFRIEDCAALFLKALSVTIECWWIWLVAKHLGEFSTFCVSCFLPGAVKYASPSPRFHLPNVIEREEVLQGIKNLAW